jgi:hypothetical protein
MQTPISFILDLILDYELPADAQKRCRKYIRELESTMGTQAIIAKPQPSARAPGISPRMPIEEPPTFVAPQITPPKLVGGEIHNGDGTRGPRKF